MLPTIRQTDAGRQREHGEGTEDQGQRAGAPVNMERQLAAGSPRGRVAQLRDAEPVGPGPGPGQLDNSSRRDMMQHAHENLTFLLSQDSDPSVTATESEGGSQRNNNNNAQPKRRAQEQAALAATNANANANASNNKQQPQQQHGARAAHAHASGAGAGAGAGGRKQAPPYRNPNPNPKRPLAAAGRPNPGRRAVKYSSNNKPQRDAANNISNNDATSPLKYRNHDSDIKHVQLENEIDDLTADLGGAKRELAAWKLRYYVEYFRLTGTRNYVGELQQQQLLANEEVNNLNLHIDNLVHQNQERADLFTGQVGAHEDVVKRLEEREGVCSALESELAAAKQDHAREVEGLQKEIQILTGSVIAESQANEAHRASKEEQAVAWSEREVQLMKEVNDTHELYKAKMAALEAAVDQKKEEFIFLTSKCAASESARAEIMTKYAQAEAQREVGEADLKAMQNKFEMISAEMEKRGSRYNEESVLVATLRAEHEHLKLEYERKDLLRSQMKAETDTLQDDARRLTQELVAAKKELQEKKAVVAARDALLAERERDAALQLQAQQREHEEKERRMEEKFQAFQLDAEAQRQVLLGRISEMEGSQTMRFLNFAHAEQEKEHRMRVAAEEEAKRIEAEMKQKLLEEHRAREAAEADARDAANAAIRIQSIIRGNKGRNSNQDVLETLHGSRLKMLARKNELRAAVKLQKRVRILLAKKHLSVLVLVMKEKERAATLIQSAARGVHTRRQITEGRAMLAAEMDRAQREAAILKLQTLQRKRASAKRVGALRRERETQLAIEEEMKRMAEKNAASMRIQQTWRTRSAKKSAVRLAAEAATVDIINENNEHSNQFDAKASRVPTTASISTDIGGGNLTLDAPSDNDDNISEGGSSSMGGSAGWGGSSSQASLSPSSRIGTPLSGLPFSPSRPGTQGSSATGTGSAAGSGAGGTSTSRGGTPRTLPLTPKFGERREFDQKKLEAVSNMPDGESRVELLRTKQQVEGLQEMITEVSWRYRQAEITIESLQDTQAQNEAHINDLISQIDAKNTYIDLRDDDLSHLRTVLSELELNFEEMCRRGEVGMMTNEELEQQLTEYKDRNFHTLGYSRFLEEQLFEARKLQKQILENKGGGAGNNHRGGGGSLGDYGNDNDDSGGNNNIIVTVSGKNGGKRRSVVDAPAGVNDNPQYPQKQSLSMGARGRPGGLYVDEEMESDFGTLFKGDGTDSPSSESGRGSSASSPISTPCTPPNAALPSAKLVTGSSFPPVTLASSQDEDNSNSNSSSSRGPGVSITPRGVTTPSNSSGSGQPGEGEGKGTKKDRLANFLLREEEDEVKAVPLSDILGKLHEGSDDGDDDDDDGDSSSSSSDEDDEDDDEEVKKQRALEQRRIKEALHVMTVNKMEHTKADSALDVLLTQQRALKEYSYRQEEFQKEESERMVIQALKKKLDSTELLLQKKVELAESLDENVKALKQRINNYEEEHSARFKEFMWVREKPHPRAVQMFLEDKLTTMASKREKKWRNKEHAQTLAAWMQMQAEISLSDGSPFGLLNLLLNEVNRDSYFGGAKNQLREVVQVSFDAKKTLDDAASEIQAYLDDKVAPALAKRLQCRREVQKWLDTFFNLCGRDAISSDKSSSMHFEMIAQDYLKSQQSTHEIISQVRGMALLAEQRRYVYEACAHFIFHVTGKRPEPFRFRFLIPDERWSVMEDPASVAREGFEDTHDYACVVVSLIAPSIGVHEESERLAAAAETKRVDALEMETAATEKKKQQQQQQLQTKKKKEKQEEGVLITPRVGVLGGIITPQEGEEVVILSSADSCSSPQVEPVEPEELGSQGGEAKTQQPACAAVEGTFSHSNSHSNSHSSPADGRAQSQSQSNSGGVGESKECGHSSEDGSDSSSMGVIITPSTPIRGVTITPSSSSSSSSSSTGEEKKEDAASTATGTKTEANNKTKADDGDTSDVISTTQAKAPAPTADASARGANANAAGKKQRQAVGQSLPPATAANSNQPRQQRKSMIEPRESKTAPGKAPRPARNPSSPKERDEIN